MPLDDPEPTNAGPTSPRPTRAYRRDRSARPAHAGELAPTDACPRTHVHELRATNSRPQTRAGGIVPPDELAPMGSCRFTGPDHRFTPNRPTPNRLSPADSHRGTQAAGARPTDACRRTCADRLTFTDSCPQPGSADSGQGTRFDGRGSLDELVHSPRSRPLQQTPGLPVSPARQHHAGHREAAMPGRP